MLLKKCRARQSIQRLGISKWFPLRSGQGNSVAEVSQNLKRELTKEITVPFDKDYLSWLKRRGDDKPTNYDKQEIKTQLQDYYIYNHPSQKGWLSKHGFREYAESIPRKLEIVDSTYTITDMGQVLIKGLMGEKESESFSTVSHDVNPFILTVEQKIFFFYNLLISDGDFLIPFIGSILEHFSEKQFSYLNAGNLIPDIVDQIVPYFSGMAYTSEDIKQMEDLENMKLSIQKHIEEKSEKKGSGSRREQECIPRLEWMVDLDILTRLSSRNYRFTELGKRLINDARSRYDEYLISGYADQAIQKIIDRDFYEMTNKSYFATKASADSTFDILQFVGDSYETLKGVSGYCLFRPLLLLANIVASSKRQSVFLEYENGLQLLEKAFQNHSEKIYYTTDRFGTDVQIKLL